MHTMYDLGAMCLILFTVLYAVAIHHTMAFDHYQESTENVQLSCRWMGEFRWKKTEGRCVDERHDLAGFSGIRASSVSECLRVCARHQSCMAVCFHTASTRCSLTALSQKMAGAEFKTREGGVEHYECHPNPCFNEQYVFHKGHCYNFVDKHLSFNKARKSCRRHSGDVASILDPSEESFILTEMAERSMKTIWIGLKNWKSSSMKWTDGSKVAYRSRLGVRFDDAKGVEKCVQLGNSGQRKGWHDRRCKIRAAYICKHPMAYSGTMCQIPSVRWPMWSIFANNRCYLVSKKSGSYKRAEKTCEDTFNMSIADASTQAENDFIGMMVGGGKRGAYIGIKRRKDVWLNSDEDYFHEASNSSSFILLNWADGQPYAFKKSPACAVRGADGHWYAKECAAKRLFICRGEAFCESRSRSQSCKAFCTPGFVPTDGGHACSDVDECQTSKHGCKHLCVNTVGSFQCACRQGYQMNSEGACRKSCARDIPGFFKRPYRWFKSKKIPNTCYYLQGAPTDDRLNESYGATLMTYDEAQDFCVGLASGGGRAQWRAHLVQIESEAENDVVKKFIIGAGATMFVHAEIWALAGLFDIAQIRFDLESTHKETIVTDANFKRPPFWQTFVPACPTLTHYDSSQASDLDAALRDGGVTADEHSRAIARLRELAGQWKATTCIPAVTSKKRHFMCEVELIR